MTHKRFLTLFLIATLAISAWAVPAYRGWQQRTLTDGTPVTVRLIGDEAYHHWETQDGKIATMLSNGEFVVSNEQAPSMEQVVKLRKAAADRRNINRASKNYGDIQPTKLLVILVNFSDKSMKSTHNKAFFENLLNGSFPSVQDYFKQSSGNKYEPVFDVFGPYTLDYNMAYYGANDSEGNDEHPDQMVVDACAKAYADGCNFSHYDTNGDGKVDNIYVIYAGYGEAAGAPANTIWPHSWEIYSSNVTGTLTYNGKTLKHYACSAELSGKSGSNSDGVGTFAHEFSHVIGLPDYYDTDYGTNSDNGVTPGEWTLMDQGSYNGSGQYPPLYSIYDKYFMGWTTPKFLAKDEIKNVTMTTTWNDAYQINGGASRVACTNTNTVYYIENRQKSGYDQYLPGHGMVVWKVQYNSTRWSNNDLNNTAGTLRYTIVPADGKTKNYGNGADPFPGTSAKKTWTPFTGCALTDITESGGNISFSYNGGVPKLTWDYVLYGENCTYPEDGEVTKGGALNLTITPNSGCTLADAACWDVQMGGTKLTYGTDFTYNAGTNKFTITSVTGDVEIIVEGGRTVNWYAQGALHRTNVSVGGTITLPDAPANCSASRQFVGWCTNSTYKSADTPPTYAKTGDAYSVANYYAVYADVSGGGSADATYTFTSMSWEATEGNWTSGRDGTAYLNSGVQVTQTTTGANATCPTSYSNISSIVVSYCTNASKGAGSIKMTVDGNDVSESVTSTGGTTPRDLEFDFSGTTPTGAPTITVNCNTNSIYICGLTITYGSASYSGFSTDCTAPDPCALTSISLNTTGVTKAFTVGDAFNSDGLVVTANYSNCSSKTVTPNSVSTPDMSSTGNKTVTVSYTESAVTKTATYDITVSAATTYAIRFFDGATMLKKESLIMGATATPPSVDDCEEYEFIGWYTTTLATTNTTSHTWVSDFTVTGAQDYYAVYSHTTGGGGSTNGSRTFNFSSIASANSWENSVAYTEVEDSPITITAEGGGNNGKWYTSGGGSWRMYSGGTVRITVTGGSVTSVTSSPACTFSITEGVATYSPGARTDYTSITVNYTVSGGSTTYYTTTKDCTIPTEVTVKFDANGGEGTMTDQTIDYNTATALKANTFERTGYTFLGWATSSSGAQVYDDEEVVTLTKKVTTLYALWEKNSWKVYFTTPSGATSVTANGETTSPLTIEYGETVTIVITPDAEHNISTVTATGGAVLSGEGGTRTFTMPDADVAISIVMVPKPTYTINFINMGENISSQSVMEGQAAIKPADPSACEGYTFVGWWTDNLAIDNTTAETWITDFTVTGNQDYYAVYSHTASGGGSSPGSKTFNFAALAAAGSWTDGSYHTSIEDAPVTLTANGGGNNGRYYVSDDSWRLYNGGSISISVTNGDVTSVSSSPSKTFTITDGDASLSLSATTKFTSITVNYTVSGGSTTTYTTAPDCTPCLTKVTLTKGEESNGTFTLSKANGEYNNCTSNFVVTVSDITPASGYYCIGVTATGDHNTVTGPDGSGNYTVTYEKENAITSTITANFALIPTYTVTWSMDGDESNTANYHEGDAIVFPGTATGCDGKVFRGWSAITVAETDVEPTYVTSATMPAHDVTYYAVFAEASSGSGTPTTLLSEDFSSVTNGNSTSTSGSSTSWSGNSNIENVSTVYQAGEAIRIGASSTGSIETKTLNATAGSTITVSFDVKGWTSVEGDIRVTVTGCTPEVISYTETMSGSFQSRSAEFTLVSDNPTVTIATTAKRAFIDNLLIISGGGTTYTGYTTTCGAGISAQNIGWMTTAAGKKVKRVINVSAKNFDDPTTLTATCANSNFAVSLGETAVPAGVTGLTTTLTVEYTPTVSNTREENVEIVLTAADKSRTITVDGRSVPDEFLLITKKSTAWYALPANMNSGAGEYDGVEVSPNDPTTPTAIAVSPTTLIYNLASVASSRYAENGHLVRLVGNNTKCLWGNKATGATKVNIQNYASLGESNGDNYEWDLKTTDGVHYFVESPCNAEYAEGRRLAYGAKFGMYKEETVFFIVQAGCTSQPGEVNVSPRRVDATFSWVSNATEMHIDLYTNELMTEGHLTAIATSSPFVFSGLAESTDYWYKLTPGTDTECAVTGTFKTSGPIIDIVEWQENGVVLFIDKGDINPVIVIDGQEEHGSITGGGEATELFFAKYFEGAGSMKLLSIFNGTKNDISLSNYKFYDRHAGDGATSYGSDSEYDLSSLGSIKAGQEIIFFSRPLGTEPVSGCSTSFLNAVATKNTPEDNPRWIECASGKFANKAITINGNDAILLTKSGTIIDVIGALNAPGQGSNCSSEDAWEGTIKNMDKGKSPSDPVFDAFYEASSKSPVTTADSIALLAGFGINLSADEIDIPTARCIFFRDKRVQNGDSAVALNTDDFVTFTNHTESGTNYKAEWYGRSVCMTKAMKTAAGVANDAQATCNSYQDIANMDYNQYYIDWTNIDPGQELSKYTSDPETKEYTIPIADMSLYACLNLRFQLKLGGEVLTEASQQVPIVITGDVDTNDPLFSELVEDKDTHEKLYPQSVTRCSTCDVVVLGTGKLTKGPDGDSKDVPEIGNLKIYPGGKLIVPSGTNYTVNSLSFRRQEDAVSTADVQGTLNVKEAGNHVYLDFRVDPTNWHYFSLPYDCNVADIRYANPEETAVPALGTNYLLKYYDGEKRAATQAGGCWEMVAPDATLKKGLGYIFAIPGDGKVKTEFRFPMANGVIADDQTDKMAQGVYGYGCDKDYTQVRANHRGWNLVGNPYFLPYTSDITDPLLVGKIVPDNSTDPWDGHYKFDEAPATQLHYIVEPVNNGWSEYRQVAIADYEMTPFTCYFVQIGGTNPAEEQGIAFDKDQVTGRSSIVRRAPAEYEEKEDTHPVWCAVTLSNAKGETDETTMLISNDFTDDYDIMNDLVKMRGSYYQYKQITTKPVLASRNNEGEMAFNALPDSSALAGIPLNYFAAFQGEYVFAYDNKYDRDGEVKEVKLLDTKTNTWYDLMSENYTFTTNREDNTTRFILSIRVERKAPHVATDLDLTNTPDDGPRKVMINDHVYIRRGGAIYDMTGKKMWDY